MKISEMSNEELKKEYEGVCEMIDVVECYGTLDLRLRFALEKEIDKRGGKIYTRQDVVFQEVEEE
jgi:hypothetical protein